MKITRHEEFEVAHILPNYNGPCGNLHGHTYKIEVTVEGPQNPYSYNMVMDFKDLKQAIRECIPDHRFVYNMNKPSEIEKEIVEVLSKYNVRYVGFPFETTAENMVGYFATLIDCYIKDILDYKEVNVVKVELWETTNSHAIWEK